MSVKYVTISKWIYFLMNKQAYAKHTININMMNGFYLWKIKKLALCWRWSTSFHVIVPFKSGGCNGHDTWYTIKFHRQFYVIMPFLADSSFIFSKDREGKNHLEQKKNCFSSTYSYSHLAKSCLFVSFAESRLSTISKMWQFVVIIYYMWFLIWNKWKKKWFEILIGWNIGGNDMCK